MGEGQTSLITPHHKPHTFFYVIFSKKVSLFEFFCYFCIELCILLDKK